MNIFKEVELFINRSILQAPQLFLKLGQTIIVIFISILLIKVGKIIITKFFNKQKNFKYTINEKKADTLSTILISILRYSIYIIATLIIINNIFDIKITIITAAGIGGIAIGFGAQSLVRDVITGFFILLEDQFSVGDIITIDGMKGTVEEIEMRITKLRHFNGDLFIIPNGEIKKIINHTTSEKIAIVDIKVSYQQRIQKVFDVINKTLQELENDQIEVIQKPELFGIIDFTKDDVTIRITSKAEQGKHAEIERYIRKSIKESFEREGI